MTDDVTYKKVSDVARMFAVTPYTVREWLKDGKLPGSIKVNKQWKIPQSAIESLAHQQFGA